MDIQGSFIESRKQGAAEDVADDEEEYYKWKIRDLRRKIRDLEREILVARNIRGGETKDLQ
jgi:hypothetical protein